MAEDAEKVQQRADLINAGFRPARHAGPVRLVRRLLWPFIRPFHFHLLDVLLSLQRRSERHEDWAPQIAALQRRSERHEDWAPQIAALQERITALATRDELGGLVHQMATQRAELAALTNRHVWIEETLEDGVTKARAELAALSERQGRIEEALEGGMTEARAELAALNERQGRIEEALAGGVTEERAKLAALSERQGRLERQADKASKLFLSSTQKGIFLLLRGELISDMAAADGDWDAHVLRLAVLGAQVVARRPGVATMRAVDAGAHFGLISVPLARIFDRVLSFEPNEFNYRVLQANVALNGMVARVEVRRDGLFSHPAELSLASSERQEIPLPLDPEGHLQPTAATNLGAYSFVEGGSGLSEARAYPLDALDLTDLAFMKVDVQGADGEVISGALETIRRCRPWLVFEWEAHLSQAFAVTFDEVSVRLAELGYVIRVLRSHNDKQIDYAAVPADEAAELAWLLDDAETQVAAA